MKRQKGAHSAKNARSATKPNTSAQQSSQPSVSARQAFYTVGQVASMTGLSIRTLHHYEHVGLVEPARSANGYRRYSSDDLARLQHVMLYRGCGLSLAAIKALLDDPAFDAGAALEQHLAALENQRDELDCLIETVRRTIDAEKGGTIMSDKERFEGLKRAAVEANEARYGKEARAKYGDEAIDAANANLLAKNESEWNDMNELERKIVERLSALLQVENPSAGEKAELAEMHAAWIAAQWGETAYSREAHRALAHGYLADDRFVQYYDGRAGEGATTLLVDILDEYLR